MASVVTCHPEKRHYAKGLCAGCYAADWKARHPERSREIKRAEYRRNRSRYIASAKQYYDANADRIRARSREWSRLNPDKRRTTRILRDYGLAEYEFSGMLAAQAGGCAICKASGPLTIDHDHATGKVRGLLCHHCNRALGHLRDNPDVARAAAAYLERER